MEIKKTHQERINEQFDELENCGGGYPYYGKYKREDFEDFIWSYHIDGPDNCVPVIAHFYVPKGAVADDDGPMEVFSPQQVGKARGDIGKLKDFVQAVADGKVPTVEEANELLQALTNEQLY